MSIESATGRVEALALVRRAPSARRGRLLRYAGARVLHAAVTMLLVYTLVFIIVSALPGDPISNRLANPDSGFTQATVDQLRGYYGLDRPLIERYVTGIARALVGDLGLSLSDARPVTEKIAEAVGPTLVLAGAALVVALIVAIGGSVLALYAPSGLLRRVGAATPSTINALPVYLVALVIVHIFSFQLRWFPLVGGQGMEGLVLPAVVLGVTISPTIGQVLLSSLTEARRAPFVAVARSKGLSEPRILFAHLLPATAVTNVTVLGLIIGVLLGGAVVTETVFSRPGLGSLLNKAVLQHDLPVLQAVVLIVAATYLLVNLVVDLLYPLLDPRIDLENPA